MNLDQYIKPLHGQGTRRGWVSRIDGVEFLESENVTRAEAEQLVRLHVARLIEQQDGYPDSGLRPERTLADRQTQYRSSTHE